MILTAHQPAYLPWLGYFDKIAASDIYVYLDAVQYEKNSFTNRNRIKTPQGPLWLTVPVQTKGHIAKTIGDMEIDRRQDWRRKHLDSIRYNYKKAACFADRFPRLESLYTREYRLLSDLCWDQLQFWLAELDIATKVVRQSDLGVHSAKSGLVLDLCRHFAADTYISGELGRDYLQEDQFAAAGIKIIYQHFVSPVYQQLHGSFVANLSAVDHWLNCGKIPWRKVGEAE